MRHVILVFVIALAPALCLRRNQNRPSSRRSPATDSGEKREQPVSTQALRSATSDDDEDECGILIDDIRVEGYHVQDCIAKENYIYWKIEDAFDWMEAEKACRIVVGGELMSIHTFEERELATNMGENPEIQASWPDLTYGSWIGLHRNSESNEAVSLADCFKLYKWSDGTERDYEFWSERWTSFNGVDMQPDCSLGSDMAEADGCVQTGGFANTAGWSDIRCSERLPALCKSRRVYVYDRQVDGVSA